MRYFPVNLDIRGMTVIVVGGGSVAARKCAALLKAGARVTVIAPQVEKELSRLAGEGKISVEARTFVPEDLNGALLAFATTNDSAVNSLVAREARNRGIAVNVADAPSLGTFVLPAVVARGDLLLTASTGSKCPALSAEIRRELEERFGPEYAAVTDLMGAVREKLLTENGGGAYNKRLLQLLACQDLPHLFYIKAFSDIDRILLDLFGPGYSLTELGVREKDSE